MALNSKNTSVPNKGKYRVTLEVNETRDMVLYADSPDDAKDMAQLAWVGTKWKPTKVEREYYIYDFGDKVDGNHISAVYLTKEDYEEIKEEAAIFDTLEEAKRFAKGEDL